MPELVYTGDRSYYSRSLGRVEPGREADVSGELHDHLLDRGDWEPTGSDVCGAELSDGGTCDRDAASCPYHGD